MSISSSAVTHPSHLGLEHELDNRHAGAVDSVLLATGRGTAGLVKQLGNQ